MRMPIWVSALVITLFMLFAPRAAKAQSLHYSYTGNGFSYTACTAHYGSTPPPTCVGSGNVIAAVVFNNVPVGYTGSINASSGSGGTSGYCASGTTVPCVASMSAFAGGVGIGRTVLDPTGVTGSSLQFQLSGGSITVWQITMQDVSMGTNVIGINSSGTVADFAEYGSLATPLAGLNTSPGTWSFIMDAGKATGTFCETCANGGAGAGDPISLATGNVFERVDEYSTPGQNPLRFARYYNSRQTLDYPTTYAVSLGPNWRTNFDRYLNIVSSSVVSAERPDGQVVTFKLVSSVWTPDTDVDMSLTQSGSTWTLTDHDDTVEKYSVSGSKGTLNSITARNGYKQTLTYGSGKLTNVTDSYGRSLGLSYYSSGAGNGLLEEVTTPDTITFTYGYTTTAGSGLLTSVTYNTTPSTNIAYGYAATGFPFALTSLTDENGNTYQGWTYDSQGRGTSSQLGGTLAANQTTVTYNSASSVTVTNAFGVADTYSFTTTQNVPKVTGISRAATSNTAAATESFSYDTNGYLDQITDWNGNVTKFSNDSHGDPQGSSAIIEGYGSSVARTTGITYDTTFVHLPDCITTSGLTTAFTYQTGTGNVLTRTESDTASGGSSCATSGSHTRTWTNTWGTGANVGLLLTVTGPRTDLTQTTTFGYPSTGSNTGVLTSITDALSHVTTINTYTGGGLPTKITDPNSVIRTYTYDGRLRLASSTVDTSGGNYTTSYGHDSAENLTRITMPDTTHSDYAYDNAHRLTKITNANGEYIQYTLDAMGGRTESDIYTSSSTRKRKHTATFDNLERMLTDVGWSTTSASMTTTYGYDADGNATSIEDPRSHTTGQSFDALNRLHQITDRLSHTTTVNYDAHDRVTSVADPNSHTTTYTRNGFGFVTQLASPDSGTSSYTYDLAGNLTQKTDAASVVTNHTYDANDRELTRTFPADSTHNVSKTYDQSGTVSGFNYGFGIGHLTTMTDQAGTMHRNFEERGNITHHQRVDGGSTLDTYAAYDQNNRMSYFVYPDLWMLQYTRDNAGQITSICSIQQSGTWIYSPCPYVVSSVTHLPFGPVSGFSFANGITKTNTYDLDYRLTETKDAGTSNVMDLQYTYDANDNPTAVADTVNATNGQSSISYDYMDRLTGSTSGTGGFGTLAWTYDNNGNRSTEVRNGTTVTYNYNSGTNQIHSFNDSHSTNYTYNSAGEITKQYYGSYLDLTYAYDVNEQVYTPTYSGSGSPAFSAYYNGFGQREGKSANVYWTYSFDFDGRVSQEWSMGGQTADYVYLDGQLVALNEQTSGPPATEATYYVHADRLGTPQAVTNGSKTVAWKTLYEPFGWPWSTTNPGNIVQDLGFPGQLDDAETDVAFNGARYYNYLTGAYIQTDPIGLAAGTTNIYTYANSNPFRWTDRNGTQVLQPLVRYALPVLLTSLGAALAGWWEDMVDANNELNSLPALPPKPSSFVDDDPPYCTRYSPRVVLPSTSEVYSAPFNPVIPQPEFGGDNPDWPEGPQFPRYSPKIGSYPAPRPERW